jgi:hypothetical protein
VFPSAPAFLLRNATRPTIAQRTCQSARDLKNSFRMGEFFCFQYSRRPRRGLMSNFAKNSRVVSPEFTDNFVSEK